MRRRTKIRAYTLIRDDHHDLRTRCRARRLLPTTFFVLGGLTLAALLLPAVAAFAVVGLPVLIVAGIVGLVLGVVGLPVLLFGVIAGAIGLLIALISGAFSILGALFKLALVVAPIILVGYVVHRLFLS